jgi:1-acyl-sn-glycerol-3-phosphate acyltransferase
MTKTQENPSERHSAPLPLRLLYGAYVWTAFLAIGLVTILLALFLPGLERRRRLARATARALLQVAGMPVAVKSEEHLPSGQCVIVANHASYLDGLVMTAALPPRFGFVIKREMARVPLAGVLLQRLGSEFVERFNRNRGAADARRMMRRAADGHSLVFFPEGTFSPRPGLLKFHTGAFVTAARAGCPVVPAVVRGTRRALPPKSGLPSPSRIEVEFLPPLAATSDSAAHASVELRDRARTAILSELGEPDLSTA